MSKCDAVAFLPSIVYPGLIRGHECLLQSGHEGKHEAKFGDGRMTFDSPKDEEEGEPHE